MREIKFRAWDEENKQFFNIARYDFVDNTIYSHLFACEGYLGEDLEIMQYTGLEDENGHEIYEGEIMLDGHNEELGVVEFEEGQFRITFGNVSTPLFECNDTLNIIGNIYENADLLEAE